MRIEYSSDTTLIVCYLPGESIALEIIIPVPARLEYDDFNGEGDPGHFSVTDHKVFRRDITKLSALGVVYTLEQVSPWTPRDRARISRIAFMLILALEACFVAALLVTR